MSFLMLAFLPPFWPSTLTFAFFINTITFESLSFFWQRYKFQCRLCQVVREVTVIFSYDCFSTLSFLSFNKDWIFSKAVSFVFLENTLVRHKWSKLLPTWIWSGRKKHFQNLCFIHRELTAFLFANSSHKSFWLFFMTAVVSMWHT